MEEKLIELFNQYGNLSDKELLEIIWLKALEINKSYSLPFIETKLKEIEIILYLFRSRN